SIIACLVLCVVSLTFAGCTSLSPNDRDLINNAINKLENIGGNQLYANEVVEAKLVNMMYVAATKGNFKGSIEEIDYKFGNEVSRSKTAQCFLYDKSSKAFNFFLEGQIYCKAVEDSITGKYTVQTRTLTSGDINTETSVDYSVLESTYGAYSLAGILSSFVTSPEGLEEWMYTITFEGENVEISRSSVFGENREWDSYSETYKFDGEYLIEFSIEYICMGNSGNITRSKNIFKFSYDVTLADINDLLV
ncbi:MAG: hypothetical protein IJW24_02575, partial [Clostridia bacterium]|nr:hypothetical protein [Clostridia bacterium]